MEADVATKTCQTSFYIAEAGSFDRHFQAAHGSCRALARCHEAAVLCIDISRPFSSMILRECGLELWVTTTISTFQPGCDPLCCSATACGQVVLERPSHFPWTKNRKAEAASPRHLLCVSHIQSAFSGPLTAGFLMILSIMCVLCNLIHCIRLTGRCLIHWIRFWTGSGTLSIRK